MTRTRTLRAHRRPPGRRIRFAVWADQYQREHMAERMMARSSIAIFSCSLRKHLVPAFGARWLNEIDVASVQRLVGKLTDAGLARETIAGVVGLLRRMQAQARLAGYSAQTIAARTVRLPGRNRMRPDARCFTAEESERIIAAAPQPWGTYFAILAYAGLRGGEGLGLEWPHVDFEKRVLRIRQQAMLGQLAELKSATCRADLPLSEPLTALLAAYRAEWSPNPRGLLFATATGRPHWASTVRKRHLSPLLKRLGLPHGGLHAFRHGCASAMANGGVPLPIVQKLMRHSKIDITSRYLHTTPEGERQAAEFMANLLSRDNRGKNGT